jgi:hypothetical protein
MWRESVCHISVWCLKGVISIALDDQRSMMTGEDGNGAQEIDGAAALGATMLIGFGLCVPRAQAAYTLTVQQTGTGVTATGAGSINFDALALFGDEIDPSLLEASGGAIIIGPATPTDDAYYSGITGPAIAFGPGGEFFADSGGGAIVGLGTFDETSGGVVAVPQDYVSGTSLGTSTPPGPTRPSAASA